MRWPKPSGNAAKTENPPAAYPRSAMLAAPARPGTEDDFALIKVKRDCRKGGNIYLRVRGASRGNGDPARGRTYLPYRLMATNQAQTQTAQSGNDPDAPGSSQDGVNRPARVEAIVAVDLTKQFGEGAAKKTAVANVAFTAYFGEMVFLVGPSGSGKTTFLSMVSGILRPDAGSVIVDGANIWNLSTDQLADFRLNSIGFVFQDFHLFPRLTTAENVAVPLILKQMDWDAALAAAENCLKVVGLEGRGAIAPLKLSGGEQQRVAIARAIVGSPRILILDEPTASLDGDTGKMIIAFVKQSILNSDRCILIVTHDARINEYADRIVHMEDGRLIDVEQAGK